MTPDEKQRWRNHFEVLADALAAPGKSADALMPVSAPEWSWEAWEAHELVWLGIEQTFAEIRALPDTAPGACPESEEFVWTEDEIRRDRDYEGGSADLSEEE